MPVCLGARSLEFAVPDPLDAHRGGLVSVADYREYGSNRGSCDISLEVHNGTVALAAVRHSTVIMAYPERHSRHELIDLDNVPRVCGSAGER